MLFQALLLYMVGTGAVYQSTSPPISELEIFTETARSHSVIARCGSGSATMHWEFDGKSARFLKASVNKYNFHSNYLKELNSAANKIGGDVFVSLSCASNAAIITLIGSGFAGTPRARMAIFNFMRGELRLVRSINIP